MLKKLTSNQIYRLSIGVFFLASTGLFAQNQQLKKSGFDSKIEVKMTKQYETMAAIYADHLRSLPDYQIQLGFGTLEQSTILMKEFHALRERNDSFFSQKELKLTFESPTYRVRLQYFADRIEAEKAFSEIRKLFPSAILLRPGSREIN